MKFLLRVLFFLCLLSLGPVSAQARNEIKFQKDSHVIVKLLKSKPDIFKPYLDHARKYKIRIIYTQIDRDAKNQPHFKHHSFGLNRSSYLYPASVVKLPTAALTLEKMRKLNIPGLDLNTNMRTEAGSGCQTQDPQPQNGLRTFSSLGSHLRRMLGVSDDNAYNRLYEFLGQAKINDRLWAMGYPDVRILTRLETSCSPAEHRITNPVIFVDTDSRVIYSQPLVKNPRIFFNPLFAHGPKDAAHQFQKNKKKRRNFVFSNLLFLEDAHLMLQSLIFPESVPVKARFKITREDREFLMNLLSMKPRDCLGSEYDPKEYPDSYCNYLLYGQDDAPQDEAVKIYNVVGMAYGLMHDAAYITDEKNGVEFMLSASIYTSGNGGKDEDPYEYALVGKPFMKELGRLFYEHERARRKN